MTDPGHAYGDRLSGSYFGNDEPIMIALAPRGEAVDWRNEAGHVWVPERLLGRLRFLAKAYELHLLAVVDLTDSTRFNHVQCQNMLDELGFISAIIHDPLISDLIANLSRLITRCVHGHGSLEVVIEGP
jgi:hypothetical protein